MKTSVLIAAGACSIALLSLTACSDTREEAVEDSVLSQAEAPPEVEVITDDPDGELGVATGDEPPAGKPSVVNPPEDAAQSQDSAAGQANEFARLDENSDGYVGRDEASGHQELKQQRDQLDENSDKRLDATEFSKFETN